MHGIYRIRKNALKQMPFPRKQDNLRKMPYSLLQTRYEREGKNDHAIFWSANASTSSRISHAPCNRRFQKTRRCQDKNQNCRANVISALLPSILSSIYAMEIAVSFLLTKEFYIACWPSPCSMSAPNCPCPKRDCARHSDCEECVRHHKAKDELPYCAR